MEPRTMTVTYTHSRSVAFIPMIRLRGLWLVDAGFQVAAKYRVEVLDIGTLILRRVTNGDTEQGNTVNWGNLSQQNRERKHVNHECDT
jgi:hypothetical protein